MKLNDAQERLFNLIFSKEDQEFEYGNNDCALFGGEVVEAVTGVNPTEDFKDRYKTRLGGIRLMRKNGYKDHFDFLDKNYTEIPAIFATIGDLGIAEGLNGEDAIVVVMGQIAVGLHPEKGIVRIPLLSVKKAYQI